MLGDLDHHFKDNEYYESLERILYANVYIHTTIMWPKSKAIGGLIQVSIFRPVYYEKYVWWAMIYWRLVKNQLVLDVLWGRLIIFGIYNQNNTVLSKPTS